MRLPLSVIFFTTFVFGQPDANDILVRGLLKELIEIDTTHSTGSTGKAADAMAARLRAAGIPSADMQIVGPRPERANLVVRYHGTGAHKPILLIGHLDVVEARKEDWTTDPFSFVEKDGYFYGRGTMDIKCGDAILVASLIRWKKEGFQPDRDIIVALTADEESGDENGIDWLLHNRMDLIDAEYCLNPDGGNLETKQGKKLLNELQYSEKGFLTFDLEVKNKGGHSSIPEKDNAIYRLADGLARLAKFDFPVMIDAGIRAYFEALAVRETAETAAIMNRLVSSNPPDVSAAAALSKSPDWNSLLRTTCVATMLQGGHAENALPQSAKATINCRIMPSQTPESVVATLQTVLNDPQITITPRGALNRAVSPPSALRTDVIEAVKTATEKIWPGVPVVPVMSAGGTDGKFLRRVGIPSYGVSGIADDYDDVRAHGRDERIAATALYEGRAFFYELVKAIAAAKRD